MTATEPSIPRVNDVGDVILEDARQIRALADPRRLAAFEWLQRHGPATDQAVAEALRLPTEAATSALATLAAAGLVEERDGAWRAPGRGIFLQASNDPEAAESVRALGRVMLGAVAGLPQRWIDEVEPTLDADWAAAAGLFNAGVILTRDELERVQQELERILEPYLNRPAAEVPPNARKVRVLGYFLPGDVPRDRPG